MNRFSRIVYAKKHVKRLHKEYEDEIQREIKNTILIHSPQKVTENASLKNEICPKETTKQVFLNTDTVSAIYDVAKLYPEKRIAVLNFADYVKPGGMFLEGCMAQEECLCAESTLFPVLNHFKDDYYKQNQKALCKSLYTNTALYTKDVLFLRESEEPVKADVLTCAAPNYTLASKHGVSQPENNGTLRNRMRFLKMIIESRYADIWILGAWGCGVFGQDAEKVASLFREINKHADCDTIIYAVPGNDKTANTFRETFNEFLPEETLPDIEKADVEKER